MAGLSDGSNLNGYHRRVLCSGIAHHPEDRHIAEAGRPELFQEGISFPGTGDSGKPICLAGSYFGRERFMQDEFRDVSGAAGS